VKGIDCDCPPLPLLDFRSWSQPAWESAEHKTRGQEVTRPSQRSELDVMTVE
jgi:hypothetical protein